MADPRDPIVMIGGVPVVEAPQEIDVANARPFREILVQAACRGHAPAVVNMTGTRFCDASGVKALLSAQLIACCLSPDDLPALGVDMSQMAVVARG